MAPVLVINQTLDRNLYKTEVNNPTGSTYNEGLLTTKAKQKLKQNTINQ
jgi:hypothetical protein